MKKIKRVVLWKTMIPLEIAVGVLILAVTFVIAVKTDMKKQRASFWLLLNI